MVECSDASGDASPRFDGLLASRFHARSLLTPHPGAFHWRGASPLRSPRVANQYNCTHLDAQQRATPTQCDVHGGLFGGFGWEWLGANIPPAETIDTRRSGGAAFNIYCYGSATLRQQVRDVIASEVD